MKSIIKLTISFFVVTFMMISSFSYNILAASKDNNQTEFESFLIDLAKNDPQAKVAFDQYSNLSEAEKAKFVDILYSEEYVKAVSAMPDVEVGESRLFHNGDIVVQTRASNDSTLNSSGSDSNGIVHEVKVYGIFVTQYYLTVYFKYKNHYYVTETTSAKNSHTNVNPAILVSDGATNHWAEDGWARAWGKFNVTLTATPWRTQTHVLNIQCNPYEVDGWLD
ncbi:hypothetical protein [Bacillus chungangensis]|uniref:Uncharacterized protein n=1 Tax=Bacillus chungangensis TaxID=587633 RepID=A0ABT9WV12_9BACI|nr:hypothetical protein [Bacillus chungangensis]MDQ0177042.1 hypothetical protein [Bacillus chungangensis]